MRPLNRLESLGWQVAAQDFFALPPCEARMLRMMVVERPGHFCSPESLLSLKAFQTERGRSPERLRVVKQIGRIRAALHDIGLPLSAIENDPAEGYAIARHIAVRVRALVEHFDVVALAA